MDYNVREFGAQGDGMTNDQSAIQRAIDKCHHDGGGYVRLEGGTFLAGTIYLRSNVFLQIDAGAVLAAWTDIACYGQDTHHHRYRNEPDLERCWIYAEDAENIGLTGFGMIDGRAERFPNEGSIYRPMMIRLLRCRNVHISNLRLYNSAAWTTAFLDSSYIYVDSVDIQNEKNYNGDGLDFDGCSHVYVSNCNIRGTDDNLCLQASNKDYPVEDIHITNCSFSSVCAAIRIGLKSIGIIDGVVISNCTMHRVWREGIKIECSEGGSISNIEVSNIVMRDVTRPIFMILNNFFDADGLGNSIELEQMPEIGRLENVRFRGIRAVDSDEMKNAHRRFNDDVMGCPSFAGVRIDANQEHKIREVAIEDFSYDFIGGVALGDIPSEYPEVQDQLKAFEKPEVNIVPCSGNYYPDWSRAAFMDIRNVEGLLLHRVRLGLRHPDERPSMVLQNCRMIEPEQVSVYNIEK